VGTDVYALYLRAFRAAAASERLTVQEPNDAAGQLALALGRVDGKAAQYTAGSDKFKTRAQVLAEIARLDAAPRNLPAIYRAPSRLRQRRRSVRFA